MRPAKAIANVDVHTRSQRAADRTGSNGTLRGVFDTAEVLPHDTVTFAERIKRLFPSPEVLDVAGRVIEKGLVLTPTMGLTIVLALGTIFGTFYWRMSDTINEQGKTINTQNELLIRLDQRLLDKGTHDDQRFQKLEHSFDSVEAWQGVTNKDIATIKVKTGIK